MLRVSEEMTVEHKQMAECEHCGGTTEVIPFGKDSNGNKFALTNKWPQKRWLKRGGCWYCYKCRNQA